MSNHFLFQGSVFVKAERSMALCKIICDALMGESRHTNKDKLKPGSRPPCPLLISSKNQATVTRDIRDSELTLWLLGLSHTQAAAPQLRSAQLIKKATVRGTEWKKAQPTHASVFPRSHCQPSTTTTLAYA